MKIYNKTHAQKEIDFEEIGTIIRHRSLTAQPLGPAYIFIRGGNAPLP
jgi:hypothetical protein